MYGSSTGFIPIHVSAVKIAAVIQNKVFLFGLNFLLLFMLFLLVRRRITKILITRANTPPNLFGIDRKIAYANRKYHSG